MWTLSPPEALIWCALVAAMVPRLLHADARVPMTAPSIKAQANPSFCDMPHRLPSLQRRRYKDCSEVRGYPYKRSHLVALRAAKISASDPPSTWWPGERR